MSVKRIVIISLICSFVLFIIQKIFSLQANLYVLPVLFFLNGFNLLAIAVPSHLTLLEVSALAFPLSSSLIVIMGYFISYLMHFSLSFTTGSIIAYTLLSSFYLLITKKQARYISLAKEKEILVLMLCLSSLVVIPLSFIRVQQSYEGNIHLPIVYQIMNGIIPPDHFALAGIPINTYWLYSLYLAVGSIILNMSALQVSVIVGLMSIFSVFTIGFLLSRNFVQNSSLQILGAFLLVMGPGLYNGTVFLVRLIRNPGIYSTFKTLDPSAITNIAKIFPVDGRLLDLVHKFLSIDGFRLGFVLNLTLVLIIVKLTELPIRKLVIPLFITLLGLALFHPVSFIPAVIFLFFFALIDIFGSLKKASMLPEKTSLFILASILTVSVLIYPYIQPIQQAFKEFNIGLSFRVYSLLDFQFTYLLFLPFAYDGLKAMIGKSNSIKLFALAVLFFVLFSLSIFLLLPDNNQYKFVFLSSIPLSILTIKGIEHNANIFGKKVKKIILYGFFIFTFLQYLFILVAYTSSRQQFPSGIESQGTKIISTDRKLEEVAVWIRKNSEPNAIVAALPRQQELLSAIVQRRIYFAKTSDLYIQGHSQYAQRQKIIENLVLYPENERLLQNMVFEIKNDPVYLLIDTSELSINPDTYIQKLIETNNAKLIIQNSSYVLVKIGKRGYK
ncbi:hypothetical protein HYW55_03165 [Candidatus Gottesmanbacteria bacterium]|nr:hypothetical protein [Candidatus Gottesmanbacteria bacterium]